MDYLYLCYTKLEAKASVLSRGKPQAVSESDHAWLNHRPTM